MANSAVNISTIQFRFAEFCLHWQTASCVLSTSKRFQCLKKLALCRGKNASEVSIFVKINIRGI